MSVLVSRVPAAIRDTARFTKVLRAKPAALSQTVLTVGQENLPLALTRDFGAGSVLLFTTTADRTWNQLPIHPLYTMLLNQAASTMTSKQSARNVIVGDSALVPIPERQPGKNVTVRTPQGQAFEVTITQSGVYPVCKVDTHQVGVHEILLGEGEDAPRALMASNVDPAESNVAVVSESILKRNLSPLDVEVVSKDKLANAIVESRTGRSLTILLLALGIFVFLLQSFLAKYFTNRMSQPDVDVAESLQMSRVAAARRT